MIGAALLTNISLGFADSFFETFAILLAACMAVADARWGWPLAATLGAG